ncbi:MAG TPA: DUF2087 domain-containing protein [Candidatus Saccharimonadia bacterium]
MPPRINRFLNANQQLVQWPASQADQALVLDFLANRIPADKNYTEPQINELLKGLHTFGDWSMLRRALVDTRRLHRTPDGARYWRPQPHIEAYFVGGVVLLRRRVLAVRLQGGQVFTLPGTTVSPTDSPTASLVQALQASLNIAAPEPALLELGDFAEHAPGQPNETDHWHAYLVPEWQGQMHHAGQVEELQWLTAAPPAAINLDPVMRDSVIPLLREQNLID